MIGGNYARDLLKDSVAVDFPENFLQSHEENQEIKQDVEKAKKLLDAFNDVQNNKVRATFGIYEADVRFNKDRA